LGSKNKLIDAPVGLFSITRTGEIIEINSTLKRWLSGPKKTKPKHIDEFIENSRELLERSDSVGEIIRIHSRLITHKEVSMPSIMVGVWASSEDGESICNVSIHGYYSIGFQKSPSSKSIKENLLSSDSAEDFSAAPVAILHLVGTQLGKSVIKSENFSFNRMSAGVSGVGKTFDKIFDLEKTDRSFLDFVAYECETDKPFDAVLASPSNLNVSVYIVSESEIEKSFRVYMVDTSARKLLEDQLVQSQKMQAIGQLAAGVAHDFNNLLTAIRLNTDELLQRHPIGDPSYPELQNINTTGIRAAALVKKLLAFSRKQTRRTESISVTDILTEMVVTLKQTLGERVKLKIVHGRDLPLVRADRSQIDTVLMNLCVNARDAMEKSNGGIISISSYFLKREVIDNPSVQLALKSIMGDDFVVIEVADTGEGMTEDVKSKIFEPFFTTKEIGKGTGLGLATVYGIIKQSGGHLTVDSSIGKGTTFRIYLPSSDQKVNIDLIKPPTTTKRSADLTGQGSILFVEDEISVRDIASKSLRRKGYKVVEADDGEEALDILKNSKESFDLMISDVVMPSMDGPTLLRKGRDLLGTARIVFVSGYAEDDFSELLSDEADVSFLPKPFTLAQLAEKVKDEIGESDAKP
jgi:two-component system cell cycle sensor histidine kinase/response regulator CckA